MPTLHDAESETRWIAQLSAGDGPAVCALRQFVRERLGKVFGARRVTEADLDDFTQDACVRILASLELFRGDARFTTWVMAIAVRVAMTALRRRRWTREQVESQLDAFACTRTTLGTSERAAELRELFEQLTSAIQSHLTERQRQVILAELSGVPQVMIAEHLGSTPNAIYKVSHDARKRIRSVLEDYGFDADAVRGILASASMEKR